ncbi:MAG TPA: biotin/lipoyl-binding protein, partial [Thermoanaerobaculia bacterium]|nr:biotin/lipoyl-binding protein [Thermoanaerobaculia bacterium]
MNPKILSLPRALPAAAFIAFLVLALGAPGCGKADGKPAQAALTPEPIRVTAASVVERTLPRTLAVTGALVGDESADVAAERDGRVARVTVERGSIVERGAILALLDDREAKATLEQA